MMKDTYQENKNFYEILEVSFSCTQEDIQQAYNRAKSAYTGNSLALYSLMTEAECKEILALIDQAYTVLGDPVRRAEYDKAKGINQKQIQENENSFNQFDRARLNTANTPGDSLENLAQQIKTNEEERDFKISKREADISKVTALSRYKLDYEIDEVIELEIEQAEEFSGEFLQKVREYKGVNIPRMADMTKISKTHIKNIEAENFEGLPAEVYVRGFVYQYAKVLKLNPDIVTASYLGRIRANRN